MTYARGSPRYPCVTAATGCTAWAAATGDGKAGDGGAGCDLVAVLISALAALPAWIDSYAQAVWTMFQCSGLATVQQISKKNASHMHQDGGSNYATIEQDALRLSRAVVRTWFRKIRIRPCTLQRLAQRSRCRVQHGVFHH